MYVVIYSICSQLKKRKNKEENEKPRLRAKSNNIEEALRIRIPARQYTVLHIPAKNFELVLFVGSDRVRWTIGYR